MTPTMLAELVRESAVDVLARRGLDPAILPAEVTVERPRDPGHGDYATAVALRTAGRAAVSPREFAQWLAEALTAVAGVRSAEVAGPGFLNLRLETAAQAGIVHEVLAAGEDFGTGASLPGRSAGCGPGFPGAGYPEYDVQYAHARLVALVRNAADLGISSEGARLGLLEHEQEGGLIRMLGEFPRIAASGRPDRVARYLTGLADASHTLTENCRVLPMGDEPPGPRHAARLALCRATRQVLANGLRLLGCSAVERM